MQRIIVTGATSMLGVALIEYAVKYKTEVYALVRKDTIRLQRLPKTDRVHPIDYELHNLSALSERLPKCCDAFYHFAWAGTGKELRDNPRIQAENIQYTLDAVELCASLLCKKFVFAGSQAEYGMTDKRISVKDRVKPTSSYGICKYAAGALSKKLCKNLGIKHLWGRIFSVYGKNDNDHTMIALAIKNFLKHEPMSFSSGLQLWNYLHESDAGRYFYEIGAAMQEDIVCNIASNHSAPLREYIQVIAKEFGAEDLCLFAKERGAPAYGLEADVSELEQYDLYPRMDFRQGIKELVDFYKRGKEN